MIHYFRSTTTQLNKKPGQYSIKTGAVGLCFVCFHHCLLFVVAVGTVVLNEQNELTSFFNDSFSFGASPLSHLYVRHVSLSCSLLDSSEKLHITFQMWRMPDREIYQQHKKIYYWKGCRCKLIFYVFFHKWLPQPSQFCCFFTSQSHKS